MNVAGVSDPSRFNNLLAIGRPTILASEPDAGARTVLQYDIGWVVAPGKADELASAVVHATSSAMRRGLNALPKSPVASISPQP